MNKITCFFLVFGTVYFLESIGGFYMTSAVVFIEKQFQIPSRLSGTMVSAGDFAYIPVVVFTSYFGGKGNRARWIGGGCILISIANFLISSSNFLFPVEVFSVNDSHIKSSLCYEVNRFVLNSENATFESTNDDWLNETLQAVDIDGKIQNTYIGPHVKDELFIQYQAYCFYNRKDPICIEMEARFAMEHKKSPKDISAVRVLTALPYAFCHGTVNELRQRHQEDNCQREDSSMGPFLMIFGGLLVLGVGRTMPFSLGLPLIDDNVKKTNLPLYFAMMFFVKILGPILGLLVGGQLNKIYYNFNPPQGLTPLDPMWIGCWWLGFLIFGSLLLGPSIGLFFFPSDDLEEKTVEIKDEEQIVYSDPELTVAVKYDELQTTKKLNLRDRHVKNDDGTSTSEKIWEFVYTVKQLFQNPIYVGAMAGRIVDVLAFKGFFVFLGKYLELQFGVPQYKIQRWLAGSGVLGFACGVMVGSIAMKFFRLQGRKAAAWVAVCSFVAAMLSFANGAVGCHSVIGKIGDQAIANNFTFPSCRKDCLCEGMPFYPVCNANGDVFYSPCHAGCPLSGANFTIYQEKQKSQEQSLIFTECECAGTPGSLEVSRDYCESEKCDRNFVWFFANQAMGALFGGMGVVPGMLIILRAVPPEHRSISLGFNGFLVSLLATLPSPVFWGRIFDLSCLMWQKVCGKDGACAIYDTTELRIRIHVIYGCLRMFSLLSDVWVIYWAKGLKLIDEEEEKPSDNNGSSQELKPIDLKPISSVSKEEETSSSLKNRKAPNESGTTTEKTTLNES